MEDSPSGLGFLGGGGPMVVTVMAAHGEREREREAMHRLRELGKTRFVA